MIHMKVYINTCDCTIFFQHTQNVMSGKQFVGGKSEYNYISPRKLDLNRQVNICNVHMYIIKISCCIQLVFWSI